MSTLASVSSALVLLKILTGLAMFSGVPVFFFKLATGRYSFLKDKAAGGSGIGRALIGEDPLIQAAFEEVKQSKQWERGADAPPSRAGGAEDHIVVTIGLNGSFKVDIPDTAFEQDDGGR